MKITNRKIVEEVNIYELTMLFHRSDMIRGFITVIPDKEVYEPGEKIRVSFKASGLSGENVESIEVGFIAKEKLKVSIEKIGESRETTFINYLHSYAYQQLDSVEFSHEFTIPESAPPSVEIEDMRTLSKIEVFYELFIKVKRKFKPDYRYVKRINVGLKNIKLKREPITISVNTENISFYAEFNGNIIKPEDYVELLMRASRLYGVRNVKVRLESYGWILGKRYGIKITSFSHELIKVKASDIPFYGKTFKFKIPREVPPTYKGKYWWTWSEYIIEFHGFLRKIAELRREVYVLYKPIKPIGVGVETVHCPWCGRENPISNEYCFFCKRPLHKPTSTK